MNTNQMRRLIVRCLSVITAVWVPVVGFGADATAEPVSTDYQLQSGDIVRIQVFQEPDLDRELSVSKDGAIVLPLIGQVVVKGSSLSVVEKTVRDLYNKDYLVNPQITVTVVRFQMRTVNVIGQVNSPRAVEYLPEQTLTLLDAISRAGGFNRLADRKKVRLTRTYDDGRPQQNYIINADQLISGTASDRWVLQKDDVIFVPESML